MKYIALLLFILFSVALNAQQQYALLFEGESPGQEKNNELSPITRLQTSLIKRGFPKENILVQTNEKEQEFFETLTSVTTRLRKNDFLFIYLHSPEKINTAAYTDLIIKTRERLKDPGLVFSFYNSPNPAIDNSFNLPYIYATEQPMDPANRSVFPLALSNALIVQGIDSYSDLYKEIHKQMLLYTISQHPVMTAGSKLPFFNKVPQKLLVDFSVREVLNNESLIINAGENLGLLPGTRVDFYDENMPSLIIGDGIVKQAEQSHAVVKLNKTFSVSTTTKAIIRNNTDDAVRLKPLTFNINFPQSGHQARNTFFETIIKEIRENPALAAYVQTTNRGGDLAISDIGIKSRDSISCTIVNAKTGEPLMDFLYSTKGNKLTYDKSEMGKHSALEEYLVNTAEWNFLSKLYNVIPAIQVNSRLTSARPARFTDQGFPVFVEDDELVLHLENTSDKRIYFAVIALHADKTSKILLPYLGESFSEYFIEPGKSFKSETFSAGTIFGQARLKIITSIKPVDLDELREKDILTRKNGKNSFLAEYANIQDLEYEIRSRLYSNNQTKNLVPVSVKDNTISIANNSIQRIYFNILKPNEDGSYAVLFPDQKIPAYDCQVNPAAAINLMPEKSLQAGDQIITVFSDRAFLLTDHVNESTDLNQLLSSIIRNGRVPGSPLNKVRLEQQLVYEKPVTATRGNSIQIKMISPRIIPGRNAPIVSGSQEIIINGFALTEDNNAVKMVKINGKEAMYDVGLKFFDQLVLLAAGTNKITIEATDDKGFTVSQLIEVNYPKPENPKNDIQSVNYFLGIAIDDYRTWPPLSNAKNDVINFSKLISKKYGYLEENMVMLFDSTATRKNIIKQIRSFLVKARPNDNIIIYFSGHGNKDQLTDGDYYFIPCDGEPDDVSSAVKSTDIIDNFKNIRAKNCLLIMDACFSGLISNSVTGVQKLSLVNSDKDPLDLPSKWILTSGRATKVSDGIPGTNSPFASVLINYLRETNEQSKLTISKLIEYLKDNVPKFNKQQIPFAIPVSGEGEMSFLITSK